MPFPWFPSQSPISISCKLCLAHPSHSMYFALHTPCTLPYSSHPQVLIEIDILKYSLQMYVSTDGYSCGVMLTSTVVLVSFETSAIEVEENIEHLQLRLKSRGQISKPFQLSFACMEVHPVEAKGLYLLSVQSSILDAQPPSSICCLPYL